MHLQVHLGMTGVKGHLSIFFRSTYIISTTKPSKLRKKKIRISCSVETKFANLCYRTHFHSVHCKILPVENTLLRTIG